MKKGNLNYTFHNPNSTEDTIDLLLKVFIDANKHKVDEAIRNAANNAHLDPPTPNYMKRPA